MRQKLLYLTLFITFVKSIAQVGIKTSTPQNTLHVNGSLQVVKDLNVGGDDRTQGSSGNKGEFLMSNGADNAPVWKSIESENFLKVVFVGNKTNITPYSGSYTGTHSTPNNLKEQYHQTFVYNVSNKIDNDYLKYSTSTGIFTVVKPGFYNIVPYITFDLSLNPDGKTAGTALSYIQKVSPTSEKLSGITTGHLERTTWLNHNLSSINFFNAGDTFRIHCVYTQDFRLSTGNIHISYLTP